MLMQINLEIIKFIDQIVAEVGKPKHSYESCAVPEELFAEMKEIVTPEEMEEAVFTDVEAGARGEHPSGDCEAGRGICRQ